MRFVIGTRMSRNDRLDDVVFLHVPHDCLHRVVLMLNMGSRKQPRPSVLRIYVRQKKFESPQPELIDRVQNRTAWGTLSVLTVHAAAGLALRLDQGVGAEAELLDRPADEEVLAVAVGARGLGSLAVGRARIAERIRFDP